jgi:hypothetical protein
MKKKKIVFYIVLGAVLLIGVGVFFNYYSDSINPTLITIISGGLGYAISKFYEDLKESKQRIYEQKRIVYKTLLNPYIEVLKTTKKGSANNLTEKQISTAFDAAFDTILYGSDNVIKLYGEFRNSNSRVTSDNEKYLMLKSMALLLNAIRKDLGNKMTNLTEVQILRMFINMSLEDESEYQREFDKLKLGK